MRLGERSRSAHKARASERRSFRQGRALCLVLEDLEIPQIEGRSCDVYGWPSQRQLWERFRDVYRAPSQRQLWERSCDVYRWPSQQQLWERSRDVYRAPSQRQLWERSRDVYRAPSRQQLWAWSWYWPLSVTRELSQRGRWPLS